MTKVWVLVAYGSALVSYNFAQQSGWSFARSRTKLQATWWQNARACARTELEFALAWLGASQFFCEQTGDLCQEIFQICDAIIGKSFLISINTMKQYIIIIEFSFQENPDGLVERREAS